jgi:hypothetical protein
MITRILVNKSYRNINPDKWPTTFRELDSFIYHNIFKKPFLKSQGGVFKLHNNTLLFVARTLTSLTFQEWLDVATDNRFVGNLNL